MRILLIGGTGFLGTWLTRELCTGHDLTVVDICPFTKEGRSILPSPPDRRYIEEVEADAQNLHFLLNRLDEKPDAIIPLTGLLGSVPSMNTPARSLYSSVALNMELLESLAKFGWKPLVLFPSSDLVYRPKCVYAVNKLAVEGYLRVFGAAFGIPHLSLRMATGFGPLQERDSVINLYIKRALEDEKIPVYGEGTDRRAFVYIEDAARAFHAAMNMWSEGLFPSGSTVNVVGMNHTLKEVAHAVQEVVGGGEVVHVEWPPLAKAVDVGDLPVWNDLPLWTAEVSLKEGVERTAAWMRGDPRAPLD